MNIKIIKIWIFVILYFALNSNLLPQENNFPMYNDGINKLILIPEISEESKLVHLISYLKSEYSDFKYKKELLNSEYSIQKTKNGYKINIYCYNKNNLILDSVILERSMVDNSTLMNQSKESMLTLKNPDKLFTGKNSSDVLILAPGNPNGLIINNRSNLLLDKDILNGLVPSDRSKILNRSVARDYLRTPQNQQTNLFSNTSDGVIIPDVNGNNPKYFVADGYYNRIIHFAPEFTGVPFFQWFGHDGVGVDEFLSPCGITYGDISNGFRMIYITEYGNKRIHQLGYRYENNYPTLYYPTNYDLRYFNDPPYDISFSSGQYLSNIDDDVLWVSELGTPCKIRCISALTGNDIISPIYSYNYNNHNYPIAERKSDVYSEYLNGQANRSMLSFIDLNTNSVVLIHLNQNNYLPSSNPPNAFSVIKFQPGNIPTSVKFISDLPGSIDPVGLLVSSNTANGLGYLHKFKVIFSPQNGQWNIPISTEYMGSTNTAHKNSTYSSDFVSLNNIEAQNRFSDIYTIEEWNNNYGIRRMKPGVDVQQYEWGSTYCGSTGINISLKLSSPVRIFPDTKFKKASEENFHLVPFTINGVTILEGTSIYLLAGINNINIKLTIPLNSDKSPADDLVKIMLYLVPVDENVYNSSNGIHLDYNGFVSDCSTIGGCPFLYVYDGVRSVQDNNILHRSEFKDYQNKDITDKYKLNVYPKFDDVDSSCKLELKELNNDVSNLDRVQLKAIDHPQGTLIGVTESNDIALYFPQMIDNPTNAKQNYLDVTKNLQYDSISPPISGYINDIIQTTSDVNSSIPAVINKFIANGNLLKNIIIKQNVLNNPSLNNLKDYFGDSVAVIFDVSRSQTKDNDPAKDYAGKLFAYDNTQFYSSGEKVFFRRENNSNIIVPVGKDISLDSIILNWNRNYNISYLCTTPIYFLGYIEKDMQLLSAISSVNGNIKNELSEKDENYTLLDNQGDISLYFKKPLDETPVGWMRDYVIIVDGRYEQVGAKMLSNKAGINSTIPNEFKLYQNYPNPFNPVSTIKYDVPKDSRVKIVVYDLVGREIKTLVNEVKEAGRYNIQFNGSNLASGIYFYKIQAGDYVMTKRMVLIK